MWIVCCLMISRPTCGWVVPTSLYCGRSDSWMLRSTSASSSMTNTVCCGGQRFSAIRSWSALPGYLCSGLLRRALRSRRGGSWKIRSALMVTSRRQSNNECSARTLPTSRTNYRGKRIALWLLKNHAANQGSGAVGPQNQGRPATAAHLDPCALKKQVTNGCQ